MSIGPVESLLLTVLFVAAPIHRAILIARWIANVVRGAVGSEVRGLGLDGRCARKIPDERYARGEIEREKYERMRRDLAS